MKKMPKRLRPKSLSHRGRIVTPRRNSPTIMLALAWLIITLVALRLLNQLNVTLGQGSFFYRYSEIYAVRVQRCEPILVAMLLAWLAIVRWRWVAIVLAIFLVAWTGWAPPKQIVQHSFNMRSPSHDGAFLLEAEHVDSLREYLQNFDQRIQRSPEEMNGTRVISNPPGMTILAVCVNRLFPPDVQSPGWIERALLAEDVAPQDLVFASKTIRYAVALMVIWLIAWVAAYWLGRIFLPAPGAILFAILTCFNPSTVNFAPGKDVAQLLTICAMMACWFAALSWHGLAARGMKRAWANSACYVIAGTIFVFGMICGLIHAWIAVAVLAATWWHVGALKTLRATLLAIVGSAITVIAIYLATGWNVLSTLVAVAERFGPIQQTFALNRTTWFFIGLPIFLLFVSPGSMACIGLTIRRKRLGLGAKLLICTLAAMALTYLTGVTYELPRLWIAFLPPLTLGAMIDLPIMRARHGRALRPLVFLALISMLASVLIWAQLDVRESEYRLISGRFFN